MTKTYKKIAYKILIVLLTAVFVMSAFSFAGASSTTYSHVIDDLNTSGTFDMSKYPGDSSNYGFEVISIAESEDSELFIYVYQPSDATKELVATHINMSPFDPDRDVDVSLDGHSLYSLTLVDTDGVFDKYVVEDFVTSSDFVHYYDIAAIYRAYDKSIDGELPPGNTNIYNERGFPVGKLYAAEWVDGEVKYYVQDEEVIRITDMYVGQIYYSGGFNLYYSACYSHYVAFNTDKLIHKLLKARVVFDREDYVAISAFTYTERSELFEDQVVELSYDDVGTNTNTGLFVKHYEWDRIQDIDTFLQEEGPVFSDETKLMLSSKSWVLRFLETDRTIIMLDNSSTHYWTEISNVGVLELTFETFGITYTMGVVSNLQTSIGPDGFHFENCFGDFWAMIIAVIVIVLFLLILWPLFPYILKVIWWVITAPFKFIGWLINLAKGDDPGSKRKRKGKKR